MALQIPVWGKPDIKTGTILWSYSFSVSFNSNNIYSIFMTVNFKAYQAFRQSIQSVHTLSTHSTIDVIISIIYMLLFPSATNQAHNIVLASSSAANWARSTALPSATFIATLCHQFPYSNSICHPSNWNILIPASS